jgi:outer membrane protein, multidrug efflux system
VQSTGSGAGTCPEIKWVARRRPDSIWLALGGWGKRASRLALVPRFTGVVALKVSRMVGGLGARVKVITAKCFVAKRFTAKRFTAKRFAAKCLTGERLRPQGLRLFFVAFSGLAVAQMLSGCILSSERPDLGLDLPPKYGAGRGDSAPPALDWWRGFRSSELTSLIEEAQTNNNDIGAAIGRVMQADASSKIAGAPLLPGVAFAGSASRSRPPGGPMQNNFSVALNASYEIDFWGKNRAASLAAQETAVASRFSKEVVVLSTVASVGTAYFQVLLAQDRLRIARQNLEASNRVLTLIKQRFEAGTASQLDVAQQESLVATVRATLPPFDQLLRQSIATLAVLIGRAPADLKVKGGSLYRLTIPRVTPGLPSELLFQRPDIRLAEANLASADASVSSARAAFFPSISLTGQAGYENPLLKLLFTPQSAFYSIATNIAQPLLDGFRLEGQLEFARGVQFELVKTYCQTILSAFGDVEIALIAIADNAERERLQQIVVNTSRQAFNLAETRLREGTVDLVTVLQTQQTLFTAEDVLVQVRAARLQAVLSLFQALGGSWLPPGVRAGPIVMQ